MTGYTAFVYSIYVDFFCALMAVFDLWCCEKDLNEEDVKKIDSKVIYWLPPYNTSCKLRPLCFEKYLSCHYREDLQRLLMIDNIHNLFGNHDPEGCCDRFDQEQNVYKLFQLPEQMDLVQAICNGMGADSGDETDGNDSFTMTEVCIKEVCRLRPQVTLCTRHKKCFVKISHAESCMEPFVCKGDPPCVLSCETEMRQKKKSTKKGEKFWKTISVEAFAAKKKKKQRDVATLAESYDREIQTYMHIRDVELDFPLLLLKQSYQQYIAEMHSFDLDPRRAECLTRLRKKLSEKNPTALVQLNPSVLKEPDFHANLLSDATAKLLRMQVNLCFRNGHIFNGKCQGKCFSRKMNTVGNSSCHAYGRVISFSKSSVSSGAPPTCCCCNEKLCTADIIESLKKSEAVEMNGRTGHVKTADNSAVSDSNKEKNSNKNNTVASDSHCKGKNSNKNYTVAGASNLNGNIASKDKSVATESNCTGKSAGKSKNNSVAVDSNSKGGIASVCKDNSEASDSNRMGKNANKDDSVAKDSKNKKSNSNKDGDNSVVASDSNRKKDHSAANDANKDNFVASNSKSKISGTRNSEMTDTTSNQATGVVVEEEECSEINIDDDVDEILKLMGLGEEEAEKADGIAGQKSSNDDAAVEKFFELIGVKDDNTLSSETQSLENEKTHLRTCAYCKKKETRRKMFKKCSRCKEEKFPIQHYYCSSECLIEDWTESHEEEHLRFKKHSS